MTLRYLGSPTPALILYLPHPPQLTDAGRPVDIGAIIARNGNHWRKILTILAKLSAPDDDWRRYRDNDLLQHHEAICFADQLQPGPAWHLVAGKASWQRLGIDPAQCRALDEQQRLRVKDRLILSPYPDYRQFPNSLIGQLREHLYRTT